MIEMGERIAPKLQKDILEKPNNMKIEGGKYDK